MMKTVSEMAQKWLKRHVDALSHSQRRVLQSSVERELITRNTNDALAEHLTFGDRLSDTVARLGGSWSFILGFLVFLVIWAVTNAFILGRNAFDPYPFIFLNLVLSMLAALQAPIIMMAQNRQAKHDRINALHDYEVNLKAEIEIMALHDKLDQMRNAELVAILERIEVVAESVERLERGHSTQAPDR